MKKSIGCVYKEAVKKKKIPKIVSTSHTQVKWEEDFDPRTTLQY